MKVLQVIAWVVGIVGGVVAVSSYVAKITSPNGKRLDAVVMSRAPLLNPRAETGVDSLHLTLGMSELHDPQVWQVRFKNVGGEPILGGDIQDPVGMKINGEGKVVSANVIATFPPGLPVQAQVLPGNELTFNKTLLNPGDSFVASILYVPSRLETLADLVPLQVTGHIAGVTTIPLSEPKQGVHYPKRSLLWVLSIVSMLSIGISVVLQTLLRRLFQSR